MTFARLTGVALALASALAPSVTGCGGSTSGNGSSGGAAGGGGTAGGPGGDGGAPPQGGGGWSACFAPGTPIATPRGEVPIDRIRVGDIVLAYDEANHRVVSRPVVRTFAHPDQRPGRLLLENGRVLSVTDNHPIYRPDQNDYAPAEQIADDTRVLLLHGKETQSGIAAGFQPDPGAQPQTVYNIEVAEQHNYFAGDVLVHNKSGGAPPCTYEKKSISGTDACDQAQPCLDPNPATFEELGSDAGAPDAGTDWGPEIQRVFCTAPDPSALYPVAFDFESTSPYEDYLTLISSPSFPEGTGGSGPCSGIALGQIWTYYPEGAGTTGWQTLCTVLSGYELREQLAIRAEATSAQLKNVRFVQACDCNLSLKTWNACSGTFVGSGGASSCQ